MADSYHQLLLDMTRHALACQGFVTDVTSDGTAIAFTGPKSNLYLKVAGDPEGPIVVDQYFPDWRPSIVHSFGNVDQLLAFLRAWRDA